MCRTTLETVQQFETRNIQSAFYGSEIIFFLGPKIWELLPSDIKDSQILNIFKSNIKSWKPEIAHVICTSYILQTYDLLNYNPLIN